MATAHLVHGYLGAGKTTLAKRLEAELNAVRYSPDEWMVTLYGADPPVEYFDEYVERVYAIANDHWPRVLRAGLDVVLDFGFWTRAWRDAARQRAEEVGGKTRLYYVRCSESVARARCKARNLEAQGSLFIAENTFDVLKQRFEVLAPDEAYELIDTS